MEYLNLHTSELKTPNNTHPAEISDIVADIAGPAAAWANVEYSETSAGRDLKVIAGEGLGRVVGLRLAEIGGLTVRKWFIADQYEDRPNNWLTSDMPADLHAPFKSLKQLLRRPKPLLSGQPMLFHRPRTPATV